MRSELRAVYTIWLRNIIRFFRSKSRVIGSLGIPTFFLITFGLGFNNPVLISGAETSYISFLGPGIIGMTLLFGSVFSGLQVITDKQFGFIKETLVAPISRLSIVFGQTLGGGSTAFLQGLLFLVVAFLLGMTIVSLQGVLIALLFMFLVTTGFTALGIALASLMEDTQGFQLVVNFVIFPVFLLSGAFFPITQMPSWLFSLALFDPLTYGVEGIRFGLTGVSQIDPVFCLLALVLFNLIIFFVGAKLFEKVNV